MAHNKEGVSTEQNGMEYQLEWTFIVLLATSYKVGGVMVIHIGRHQDGNTGSHKEVNSIA